MKTTSKFLILLLAVTMLFASLAACGGSGSGDTTTQAPAGSTNGGTEAPGTDDPSGTSTPPVTDPSYTLPEEDLDGFELNIFSIMGPVTTWLTFPYFDTEESSTKISEAVFNRNTLIEEKLDCKIIEENADSTNGELWVSLLANDEDVYQAGIDYSWNSISRATTNYLVDFNTISTIDLTAPWWDQNLNEAYAVNGRVFVTSGSAMVSSWDEIFCLYFNTEMAAAIDADMNLYDEVKDNEWTLDRFNELIVAGDNYLNNPGAEDTTYGLVTQSFYFVPALMATNDVTYAKVNDEGKIYNFTTESIFVNTVQTLAEKFKETNGLYYGDAEVDDMFKNGQSLFLSNCIGTMTKLRDLEEFDYGILPMPLYDANQENYYSYSGAQYLLFVPYTNQNLDKTGTVLSAMMGMSEYGLKEIYIEEMLGVIYSRTPEAAEMIYDYILPNTLYDIGGRSGLAFHNFITLNEMIPAGNTSVQSLIDTFAPVLNSRIDAANNFQ